MGKLGKLSYPEIVLDKSIEDVRRIYKKFGSDEIADMNAVAGAIGLSKAKSGTFFYRRAALRAYGLIEGRGRIRVTELGKRISYPLNKDEELKAREKAVKNAKLFEAIYNKYGVEIPKEKFWVDLVKFTGAESPEAQKIERRIRHLYLAAVKYLKPVEKLKEGVAELPSKFEVARPSTKPSIAIPSDFTKIETEDFVVGVRRNLDSIHSFEIFDFKVWLENIKRKIEKEKALAEHS